MALPASLHCLAVFSNWLVFFSSTQCTHSQSFQPSLLSFSGSSRLPCVALNCWVCDMYWNHSLVHFESVSSTLICLLLFCNLLCISLLGISWDVHTNRKWCTVSGVVWQAGHRADSDFLNLCRYCARGICSMISYVSSEDWSYGRHSVMVLIFFDGADGSICFSFIILSNLVRTSAAWFWLFFMNSAYSFCTHRWHLLSATLAFVTTSLLLLSCVP